MIYRFWCIVLLGSVLFWGCSTSYSFKGVSISPDVKTITIEEFFNNTTLGPTDIANTFSQQIRDYFQRNTSLTFVREGGDLFIGGSVKRYTVTPVAPKGSDDANGLNFAALTRVTIVVEVSYENTVDPTFNFERRNFSFFRDFDQNRQDLSANEADFSIEIFDQIVQDIYAATLANW